MFFRILWYNGGMDERQKQEIRDKVMNSAKEAEERLSPFAAREADCLRRSDYKYNFYRRGFVRDCEAVINLAQYNRYGGKTQVFSLHANNDISTRASHVGLVSRIARTIGRALNLNCDLIEAIACAHDLGHAPFGHKGEVWLNAATEKYGYTFAHHVQSARYLDHITRSDMSLPVIDGVLCHNGECVLREYKPNECATRTFDDLEKKLENAYRGRITQKELMPATLEGCLVRICDVIAYLGKDRQDAATLGVHGLNDYTDYGAGVLNHKIIRAAGEDIIFNSYGKAAIILSEEMYAALVKSVRENYAYIYKTENTGITAAESAKMEKAVAEVYEFALDDLKKGGALLGRIYFPYIYANPKFVEEYRKADENAPERVAADFIACMCDDYFLSFYNRYLGRLDIRKTDYFD